MSESTYPESAPVVLGCVDMSILERLSREIKDALTDTAVRNALVFEDYHGFQKSRLPSSVLAKVLLSRGLTEADVQIEVVRADRDLTSEVHYHEAAAAYITILGAELGFENPQGGRYFLEHAWHLAIPGQEIPIEAGVPHGFTVDAGGRLYFLSVQSPPIVRENGHDDYFKVAVDSPPF